MAVCTIIYVSIVIYDGQGGGVVVRPDSGDPAQMVLQTLNILGDKFGTSLNSQGYKVLPPCISVIQGNANFFHLWLWDTLKNTNYIEI